MKKEKSMSLLTFWLTLHGIWILARSPDHVSHQNPSSQASSDAFVWIRCVWEQKESRLCSPEGDSEDAETESVLSEADSIYSLIEGQRTTLKAFFMENMFSLFFDWLRQEFDWQIVHSITLALFKTVSYNCCFGCCFQRLKLPSDKCHYYPLPSSAYFNKHILEAFIQWSDSIDFIFNLKISINHKW